MKQTNHPIIGLAFIVLAILLNLTWWRRGGIRCCLCFYLLSNVMPPLYAENLPSPLMLPNRIRVMIRERHATPLVAIDLWVRAGAREEKAAEWGSAHFLEHVLFKGTTLRPPGQADTDIENLGGTLNAATGPDYAHFYTTITAAKVPYALDILADLMQNARLPEAQVTKERGIILDELAQHDSDATAYLVDKLYANAFPAAAYGRSPGGSPAAIRQRSPESLVLFYRRVYRPERCTLVLTGDITPVQAVQWARQSFGNWKPSGEHTDTPDAAALTAPFNIPSPIPSLSPQRLLAFAPLPHSMLGLAFLAPPAHDQSMTAAALVAAEILEIRQYSRRASSLSRPPSLAKISVRFTPRKDVSLWIVTMAFSDVEQDVEQPDQKTAEPNWQQEEERLRTLVAGLSNRPPTPSEILTAKRHLQSKLEADQETVAGLAAAVGYADITGGESPEAQKEHISRLAPTELQQFIRNFLTAAPLCIRLQSAHTGKEQNSIEQNGTEQNSKEEKKP